MRTPSRASLALAMGFFATSGITAVAATSASATPSHASLARPAVAHHTARVVSLTVPGTDLRLSASIDDEGQVNDVDEIENEDEVNDVNDVDEMEAEDEVNDADDADDAEEAGEDQGEDNDDQEEAGEHQGEDQADADDADDVDEDNSGPSANAGPGSEDSGHGGGDD